MNWDDILKALISHRTARRDESSEEAHSPSAHLPATATPLYGRHVAARFAEEVARMLDDRQIFQLATFLSRETSPSDSNKLQEQLAQQLEDFYAAEIVESGLGRAGLLRPAGPITADFGLILHMQSKEGDTCNPFWDTNNTTIRLLALKGVSEKFTFAFDWHWRAEKLIRGRSHCITDLCKKSVRGLHDKASSDILDLLSLPFLIVAGACPQKSFTKTLHEQTKRVVVSLSPQCDLTFDLDYRGDSPRRIIGYVDHPSAWFFSPNLFGIFSTRLDAMFNFFLWVLGKEHDPLSFAQAFADHREGITFSPEMLRGRASCNKQLRIRLLQGDRFKCTKMKNGTDYGRIFVRDVHLLVPPEANFDSVFVQCHLAPEGQQHIRQCATQTWNADTANRLGIQLSYTRESDGSFRTIWCKHTGNAIVKKLNSLVDFLEDRPEEYTESQPRRFLARNKSRGRHKMSYTL